jgi:hypothetical protein
VSTHWCSTQGELAQPQVPVAQSVSAVQVSPTRWRRTHWPFLHNPNTQID